MKTTILLILAAAVLSSQENASTVNAVAIEQASVKHHVHKKGKKVEKAEKKKAEKKVEEAEENGKKEKKSVKKEKTAKKKATKGDSQKAEAKKAPAAAVEDEEEAEQTPGDEATTQTQSELSGSDEADMIDNIYDHYSKPAFTTTGERSGERIISKEDALKAGAECLEGIKGLRGKDLETFMTNHFAEAWDNSDVNGEGAISFEEAHTFQRMLMGKLNKLGKADGTLGGEDSQAAAAIQAAEEAGLA